MIVLTTIKKMLIEEQELNDWSITPDMSNEQRRAKSIEAYWLDRWYEKVKDITFPTFIYNSIDEVPDILPFKKCMVRYENKSPKDSEDWGPISTKQQLIDMFYTSLRCKTNPGKVYCVREWVELGDEYRCFWNNGLVAISAETQEEPPIDIILQYIKSISDKIFYNKCVFDISHKKDSNELIFVEFNSWESNSGAHRFNWLEDTEVFYDANCITIRWLGGEKTVDLINLNLQPTKSIDLTNYKVISPSKPSNWLVTDKHIYITNDVWLGRFTLDFKPINWTRGVFRFCQLELCEDGCIYSEPNYYYYDLTPKKQKSKILQNDNNNINLDTFELKYGAMVQNIETNKIQFLRILDNCNLVLQ